MDNKNEKKQYSPHCNKVSTTRSEERRGNPNDAGNTVKQLFEGITNESTQMNYCNTGARPKIYCSPTSSPSNLEKEEITYSRNPTELPDFVQDHLVLEQCYLTQPDNIPFLRPLNDVHNVPDFALDSIDKKQRHSEPEKCQLDIPSDLPFFLTEIISEKKLPEECLSKPIWWSKYLNDQNQSGGETTNAKSLPDFLSDGPIHSAPMDFPYRFHSQAKKETKKPQSDMGTLDDALKTARLENFKKSIRIKELESELLSKKESEIEENAEIEKSVDQVEDMKVNPKRIDNSESLIKALKMEIKVLTTEILELRTENRKLRNAMTYTRQGTSFSEEGTITRIVGDLRSAALTAELSLRQLISGVDNLRELASILENLDKKECQTKDILRDDAEDNAAGPAL
ncbi:uncharacterized protein l(3)04053 [Prorops nasuta]|uniref:uncharacterized protein l(3)04053 n=1 Tax=Prorops nasuta TaxID=863751 RepID=UPI0034CEA39E